MATKITAKRLLAADDPLPTDMATVTWPVVALYAVRMFFQYIISIIAALGSAGALVYGIHNSNTVNALQNGQAQTHDTQQYHEKQLDSIGAKVDKVEKMAVNKGPVYVAPGNDR